jgi:hypothetical protein
MTTLKYRLAITAAIVLVIVLPVVSVIVVGYLSMNVGREAQKTLTAYRLILEVLADYLTENGGKWPKSWDDLVNIRHSGYPGFRWPDDVADVRKRIRINFDLSTSDVISTDIEHFTAVTQTEPNYGRYEELIDKFLYDARRSVGRNPERAVPKGSSP